MIVGTMATALCLVFELKLNREIQFMTHMIQSTLFDILPFLFVSLIIVSTFALINVILYKFYRAEVGIKDIDISLTFYWNLVAQYQLVFGVQRSGFAGDWVGNE